MNATAAQPSTRRQWAEVAAARQKAATTPSQPIDQAQLTAFSQQLKTMQEFYSKLINNPASLLQGVTGAAMVEQVSDALVPAVAEKLVTPLAAKLEPPLAAIVDSALVTAA